MIHGFDSFLLRCWLLKMKAIPQRLMEFDNVVKVCRLCYHRISCHSQVVLLHQPTSHMIDSVLFLHVKQILADTGYVSLNPRSLCDSAGGDGKEAACPVPPGLQPHQHNTDLSSFISVCACVHNWRDAYSTHFRLFCVDLSICLPSKTLWKHLP